MMILRPTARLLAHMRATNVPHPPTSTTLLGDWFATMLQVRSGRFVIAISGTTLLPVVVHGRELGTLASRLVPAVREVLTALSVSPELIERECTAMDDVCIAATNDRSTVGVMVDFVYLARCALADEPHMKPLELALWLAKTPIVARNAYPDRDTRRMFGMHDDRVN